MKHKNSNYKMVPLDTQQTLSINTAMHKAFKVRKVKKVRWWNCLYLWLYRPCRVESTVDKIKYIAWYREIRGVVYLIKDAIEEL